MLDRDGKTFEKDGRRLEGNGKTVRRIGRTFNRGRLEWLSAGEGRGYLRRSSNDGEVKGGYLISCHDEGFKRLARIRTLFTLGAVLK